MTRKHTKPKSKLKLSKGKRDILFVRWEDHCIRSPGIGWTETADKYMPAMECESVGFKVFEDKDILVLAINQDENGKINDTMHIIKSCIKKRRILK